EVAVAGIRFVLVAAEDGQRRALVRRPGEGRGDGEGTVLGMVLLQVATETPGGDAVAEGVVERVGNVEAGGQVLVRTDRKLHRAQRRIRRLLADHVDDTARIGLAVENGGRARDQLHTLKKVG